MQHPHQTLLFADPFSPCPVPHMSFNVNVHKERSRVHFMGGQNKHQSSGLKAFDACYQDILNAYAPSDRDEQRRTLAFGHVKGACASQAECFLEIALE